MSEAISAESGTHSRRHEAPRTETDREIRAKARELLVDRGEDAVTLRAIARDLGITAPALYRYYTSREDLIRHVCLDICADLADELTADLVGLADRPAEQFFAVCRGFRRWACAHPREFALVFASPMPDPLSGDDTIYPITAEPFGRVFLTVSGRVLATNAVRLPDNRPAPEEMRAELLEFREAFVHNLAQQGIEVSADMLTLGSMYFMLEFWARLYGHVALEVFGRFPYQVTNTEPLFEAMLAEHAAEVGLSD